MHEVLLYLLHIYYFDGKEKCLFGGVLCSNHLYKVGLNYTTNLIGLLHLKGGL